jgi:ATP-dependent exoDNAse (exonuclease V) alpha subunit
MAIYRMQAKSISRSDRRSAVGAAAYRAGQRLRDERTGRLYNYSHRQDVSHTEIVWPSELAGRELSWARDRAALWNAAERAENRRNSRVAREYQVALPAELTASARQELARRFAHEIAERHHVAVDLAIHAPPATGDARNHHAHLLATTREVGESGLGAKAGLDMSYPQRLQRGGHSGLEELKTLRERWAVLTNEALNAAGLAVRVDHRSLAAQGIDREPMPQIPIGVLHRERHGIRSEVADRIREQYQARVQARAQAALQTASAAEPAAARALGSEGLEQVRQQAREAWLRMRQGVVAEAPAHGAEVAEATRGVDQDLAL